MALGPPDELERYLEFIYRVMLTARVMGWQAAPAEQIADLMDAVHNLPVLLRRWDDFDKGLFREHVAEYDKKWRTSLVGLLDACLEGR
ncbi:MAG: hypothetical protein ABR915_25180 [Thermoguttaceae bacterium]|jgi:hypothetical protein